MDPFVRVRHGTTTYKTKVYKGKDRNYGGSFYEKFYFPISGPTGLTFEVMDDDTFSRDDYFGSCTISLQNNPNGQPFWQDLCKGTKSKGKIQIQLTLHPQGAVPGAKIPGQTTTTTTVYTTRMFFFSRSLRLSFFVASVCTTRQTTTTIPTNVTLSRFSDIT